MTTYFIFIFDQRLQILSINTKTYCPNMDPTSAEGLADSINVEGWIENGV